MLVTGIDIIEIDRIKLVFAKYGDRFLNRIYTVKEREYCRGRAPQLASRFAAKEATMKALGTGVRGVGWKDIEILRNIDIGIMALGSCPRKSRKEGKGEVDGIIMIDDIAVKPKQWLYADINGILISAGNLELET